MQRIIKFRAWDGKKMLYPKDYNYIHFTEGCQSWEVFTEDEMHEYFIAATNGNHVDGLEDSALMQFTGLTDKNGKEIYEGDVITGWTREKEVVKYDELNARFSPIWFQYWDNDKRDKQMEVIGNIYENPELCKG